MSARACAVIGSPIGHSRSPDLHRAAYRVLGLPWVYERVEVGPGELAGFVDRVGLSGIAGLPCGGLSVTMPGKAEALARADVRHPRAAALGAANTLVPAYEADIVTGWTAYNTDVDGIVGALREGGPVDAAATSCVVLGAGGTSAAALAALREMGASSVSVVARDHSRAASLRPVAEHLGLGIELLPWDEAATAAGAADLLISTVPPGVADEAAQAPFHPGQVVLDAVYAGGSTALLRAAERGGARAVAGIWMLLHQAVEQVHLMTGRRPPVQVMRDALR